MSKKIGYCRGASDAISVTEIVEMNPGASTLQVAAEIWPVYSEDLLRAFAPEVESDLQSLRRFDIVEYADGWRPSQHVNPFKHIVQTSPDDESLASTLWSVSLIYFGTGERRLASAMSEFVAEPSKATKLRRDVYIFLLVLCFPVSEWPKQAKDIAIPRDIDWNLLRLLA